MVLHQMLSTSTPWPLLPEHSTPAFALPELAAKLIQSEVASDNVTALNRDFITPSAPRPIQVQKI
jgi:hypothetical protein